jgi:hypothetical protein
MTDPAGEPGYSDAPGAPRPAPNERRPDLDDEDLAGRVVRRPLPGLALAAAVLWIVAGAGYAGLFALFRVLQAPFEARELWLILCAFFFINDGVRLILGWTSDPRADGVFSALLGLFLIGYGCYQYANDGLVGLLVGVVTGALFLTAGALALAGRKQYLAWKEQREG